MKRILSISIFVLFLNTDFFGQIFQKMPWPVNTVEHNEYAPSISYDGRNLVFESNMTGRWRLYESRKMGERQWSKPKSIEAINSIIEPSKFAGGAFQTYDGKFLLFTSDQEPGYGDMDIWIAEKKDGVWTNPKNIGEEINSVYFDGFPSLTPDGKTLYFMRNVREYDQKPNSDCYFIYSSEKLENGKWSIPKMLPNPVNMFCEECPRIMPDGKTLLFSSTRQGGKGGWDIYKTYINELGRWHSPENIGFLNTPEDDKLPSVSGDGETYFLAVTKNEFDDIFLAKAPIKNEVKQKLQLLCKLFDIENNKQISGAKVEIIPSKDTSKLYYLPETKLEGEYKSFLEKGRNYSLLASAPGYSFYSEEIFLKTPELQIDKNMKSDKELSEFWNEVILNEDQKEKLKNANFDIDAANNLINSDIKVLNESNQKLERVIEDAKEARDRKKAFKELTENKELIHEKTYESYERSYLANNQYFSIIEDLLKVYRVKSNTIIQDAGKSWEDNARKDLKAAQDEWQEAVERKNSDAFLPFGTKAKELQQSAIRSYLTAFEYYMTFHNFNASLIEKEIFLTPLKKDVSIQLHNITFDFDKASLKESSFAELDKLIKLLNDNPKIKVELSAHTDDKGAIEYNQDLSMRRAQAVVDYLVSKEVSVKRLEAKGFGESKPLVPNDTEENREKNRRVEFRIK